MTRLRDGIPVRHGASVAHARTIEEAAQLMSQLAGAGADDHGALGPFEGSLREAGAALGLARKASSEEVRRGLVLRGQPDLARRWTAARSIRRAQAHPDPSVHKEVVAALGTSAEARGSPSTSVAEESTDDNMLSVPGCGEGKTQHNLHSNMREIDEFLMEAMIAKIVDTKFQELVMRVGDLDCRFSEAVRKEMAQQSGITERTDSIGKSHGLDKAERDVHRCQELEASLAALTLECEEVEGRAQALEASLEESKGLLAKAEEVRDGLALDIMDIRAAAWRARAPKKCPLVLAVEVGVHVGQQTGETEGYSSNTLQDDALQRNVDNSNTANTVQNVHIGFGECCTRRAAWQRCRDRRRLPREAQVHRADRQ